MFQKLIVKNIFLTDIMSHSDDETPLVSGDVKLYKRRWYILLIFSLVAVLQGKLLDLGQDHQDHHIQIVRHSVEHLGSY